MTGIQVEMVGLEETTVGRCRFEPGWRWSTVEDAGERKLKGMPGSRWLFRLAR